MSLHITLVNDLQDHELESTCDCRPTLDMVNGEMIFVHNAYDEREKNEPNGFVACRPDAELVECYFCKNRHEYWQRVKCGCPVCGRVTYKYV